MSIGADATLLTVTGRDVLFAHWPVPPSDLRPRVPDALALDTFDGSAWVSALALENPAVVPGATVPSWFPERGFPQLNFRTYVTADGDPGVYFLSLDSGRRVPALVGRRAFGLPFHAASMSIARRGEEVTFRSRRRDDPSAVFGARYRPAGEPSRVEPGTVADSCVERSRYFLPAPEDRRFGPAADGGLRVGRVTRDPWTLCPADATLRRNTLFEAAGLPAPAADPVIQYSPGFEMGVEPVRTRAVTS